MTVEPPDSLSNTDIPFIFETKEETIVPRPSKLPRHSVRGESLLWKVGKAAGFLFLLLGGGVLQNAVAAQPNSLVAVPPTMSELATKFPTPFLQETFGDTPDFCSAVEEFGSKHQRIVELHELIKSLPIENLEVPLPQGLSHQVMEDFLLEADPEIFTLWEERKVEEIQERILKAFEEQSAKIPFELLNDEDYLMVRSTGNEDGAVTNAGGNLSVSYVRPTREAVLEAAGRVVASYFNPTSLQNRINAGEDPFETLPKLSVTVQKLIGEPVGGAQDASQIPTSLVLFSNIPAYGGSEDFRIMRITASFGHGEAVVGKKGVENDTYYLLQSRTDPEELYITHDIQKKPHRLAPVKNEKTGEIELKKMKNPDPSAPSLSDETLKELFQLGLFVEEHYEGPTDMELVVKNGTIYPVQARPIISQHTIPTYLDTQSFELEKVSAKPLVPGRSSALVLTDREEILTANTLMEALKKFNKDEHKLVIVQQDEPSNSHPVVNFNAMGIPCLYHDGNIEPLLKKMSYDEPIMACIQQGVISLWDQELGDYPFVAIKQGFTEHPAPVKITFSTLEQSPLPEDLENLLTAVKTESIRVKDLREHPRIASLEEKKTKLKERNITLAAPAIETIEKVQQETERALAELEASYDSVQQETLFRAKVLSQIVRYDVDPMIEDINTIIDYHETANFPPKLSSFATERKHALTETGAEAWIAFLHSAENRAEVDQFHSMLTDLQETGTLTTWRTFFFEPALATEDPFQTLLNDYNPETKNWLESQKEFQQEIASIDSFEQIKPIVQSFCETFSEPLSRQGPLGHVIAGNSLREFIDKFDETIKAMKGDPEIPPEKKIPLFKEMVQTYIDLFEQVALDIVGEEKFGKKEGEWIDGKPIFENLLPHYLKNLKEDFNRATLEEKTLFPSESFRVESAMIGSNVDIGRIFSITNEENGVVYFDPGEFGPITLEDFFTLTHQDLLYCTNLIMGENLSEENIQNIQLPPPLKTTKRTS